MSEQGASVAVQVAQAADKLEEKKGDEGVVTLSNGVKLKVIGLKPLTMVEVLTMVKPPKVPVYFDERLRREVENPDDPDYKEAKVRHQMDYAAGLMNSMILFGTEIVFVPKGMQKPEDDAWIEDLELVGIQTLRESPRWRKLAWIKSVAIATGEDSNLVMEKVGGASGVREADVNVAAQAFRSQKE